MKPKYNTLNNLCFMTALSWKTEKKVLFILFGTVILQLLRNLLQLFLAPAVIHQIETAAPLGELLGILGLFLLGLMAIAFIDPFLIPMFYNCIPRYHLYDACIQKAETTSYPNLLDDKFNDWRWKALDTYWSTHASEKIWDTLQQLLLGLLSFGVYLLVLSTLNGFLLLTVIAVAVASFFVNRMAVKWQSDNEEEAMEYKKNLGYISDKTQETRFSKDIRIFSMQPWLHEIYEKNMILMKQFYARRERKVFFCNLCDAVLSFLRNGVAYVYLIFQVSSGKIGVAEFLLLFTAVSQFTGFIMIILEGVLELQKESLEITKVREFLKWEEPFRFEDGEPLFAESHGDYQIELQNVSYRYPGAEKDTISHMNLTIRTGEKLAVVGLNGAGKTTLVKLISGYLGPTEGQVLLNGKDIRQFNRRDYYRLFSAVFQEFSILDSTIEANVAQSEEKIDHKKVIRCLKNAGLEDLMEKLPNGTETHLGKVIYDDGVELSGGQIQRLMLARALYKDAPILLLDEPTAALDPIAEDDIYKKYAAMTKGKMAVFISHRLASTRFCDRILYIVDGKIREDGTHEELLAQKGGYAKLFETQSQYYREGENDNGVQ